MITNPQIVLISSDEVFSSSGGSRDGASKILIVITDGESNDRDRLPSATEAANRKSIVRFAIGVRRDRLSDKTKQSWA